MSRLFEALQNAADGAFVTDDKLRINYWNMAAEEILGFESEEIVGRLCYQILNGHDDEKRLICKAYCQMAELVLKGEPVPNYDLQVRSRSGNNRWLNMSIFVYRMRNKGDKKMIVHLFREITQRKDDERLFHRLLEVAQQYRSVPSERRIENDASSGVLTQREYEVLIHMAKGYGTREISQILSISTNTVRNHIQNILQKLQVHTRLEAVTYAINHNLID